MAIRVGINGFGRIGRLAMRIIENHPNLQVAAINSRADAHSHAHLLKYDSSYGIFNAKIEVKDSHLFVNNNKVHVFQSADPAEIPWGEAEVDVILECTGKFSNKETASAHLHSGVKKVVISAPAKKGTIDGTFVMGVNEKTYNPALHHVISNASCTTNCLAPVVKVLNESFGIQNGFLTTVHSYTNDQNIQDNSHKDLRRARTAGLSIIPTTTGAAKAVGLVLPEMQGKLNGLAMRVPTATVSIVDFVANLEKEVTKEQVNEAFKKASETSLKNILAYSEEPLVSIDLKGSSFSSIVDGLSTDVINGNFVKVLAWYDNEWGYACRLVDLLDYILSE
jgi:glyceraldehyde 3-phosphate dehydrogenase